jgi:hypothetical protein
MIKICAVCDDYFEAKRSDTKCCSKKCSHRRHYFIKMGFENRIEAENYMVKKKELTKLKKVTRIGATKAEILEELEIYLKRLKAKLYYVDAIEVYRLIDIYDKVYPERTTLPHMNINVNNYEKSFNAMLVGLFEFYNKYKQKTHLV